MNKFIYILLLFVLWSTIVYGQSKMEEIEALMSQEKISKARVLIDKALLEDETNPKLLLYKGMIIQNQLDISTPSQVKKIVLDSVYYFYSKALDYDTHHYLSPILSEQLQTVAQQYSYTGMEQFNEGKYKSALFIFERNIKILQLPIINQLDTMMLYNAAFSAEKLKDYAKERYYYQEILKFRPDDWKSLVELAKTYKNEGDTNQYFFIIKSTNLKHPEVPEFYNQLVGYYLESQKPDSALLYLEKLIKKDKANDKLQYLKGSILQEQGELEESEKAYKKSLEINPNNIDASYNLAANNYNKALDLLEKKKLTKKEKQDLKLYLSTSLLYLETVKKQEPQNKYVLSMLMTCYQELKMKKKEKELKKHIEDNHKK